MHLSIEEDCVYRRILDALWIHGPLPDDPKYLARVCHVDTRLLKRCYRVVKPLLSISCGLVDHPKIAAQRTQAVEYSEVQRQRVNKRWDTDGNTRARAPDPDKTTNVVSPPTPPRKPKREAKAQPPPPAAPAGVCENDWADWLQHRKEIRKPVSELAAKRQATQLAKLAAEGHAACDVIANSIANGYQGLFAPSRTNGGHHAKRLTPVEQVEAAIAERNTDRASNGTTVGEDGSVVWPAVDDGLWPER